MDDEEESNDPIELDSVIKVLRLITGEDLVAECSEIEDDDGFATIVMNPLKIIYLFDPESSKFTINFLRWVNIVIADNQIFVVRDNNILTQQYPSAKLADKYIEFLEDDEVTRKTKPSRSKTSRNRLKRKTVEQELLELEALEEKIHDKKVSTFVQEALNKISQKKGRGRRKKLT